MINSPQADPLTPAHNPHVADLGVLIVHGIGDQRPGSTVEQATDAILKVLHVFTREGDASLSAADAAIDPPDGPSRVLLAISDNDSPEDSISWLLAESRWADSFNAPSLTRMILWSGIYGGNVIKRLFLGRLYRTRLDKDPLFSMWSLHNLVGEDSEEGLSQVANRFHKRFPGFDRELVQRQLSIYDGAFAEYIRKNPRLARLYKLIRRSSTIRMYGRLLIPAAQSSFVIALPLLIVPVLLLALLPPMVLAILILAVVGAIPGAPSPLKSIRFGLERSVGDAFVLTGGGFGQAAMLTSVKRDIDWMAGRCKHLVVLAHSQGSVIVERLYEQPSVREKIDHALVYGSAIGLLAPAGEHWLKSHDWTCVRAEDDPINPLPLRRQVNLDGKAFVIGQNIPSGGDDVVIRNWSKLVSDHTTYWENREGFVVPVIKTLIEQGLEREDPPRVRERLYNWTEGVLAKTRHLNYRPIATQLSQVAALIVLIGTVFVDRLREFMIWVGETVFGLSANVVSLLPDVAFIDALVAWLSSRNNLTRLATGTTLSLVVVSELVRWAAWAFLLSPLMNRVWRRETQKAFPQRS
jgi:hypothetical protein